ncbi:MAG TPA: tyrosine-type recombinase/integrase [Anaerolineae bacterium]|jgi:integrase/recombinase XerD
MQWQSTIDEFLKFLETERNSSVNTVLAYKNDLGQFTEFLKATVPADSEWSAVNQETIVSYVETLAQKGYTKSTIARKIAALKTLFHWLADHGQMTDDPTLRLKSPRVDKRAPRLLTPQEVNNLIGSTVDVPLPRAARDRALLEVIYSTGMRVSEAINLRLADIDLELNEVRCTGRGNRPRKAPLLPRAAEAMREYLAHARNELMGNVSSDYVFLNPQGTRLTRQAVWLMTRQYARNAHIDGEVTPHTLRHSRAAHMLGDGQDVRRVQEWMGHANLATTQMYQPRSAAESKGVSEVRDLEIPPVPQQPI